MAYPNAPTSPPVLELDATASINSGLVGFWPLTHVSGTTATDISGSGNDAAASGTVNWLSGDTGMAADFASVTGYFDTGIGTSTLGISGGATASISAWVNYTTGGSITQNVFGDLGSGGASPNFGLYIGPSVSFVDVWRNESNARFTSVTFSGWMHFVAVYDASNTYLYINGTLFGTIASSGNFTASTGNCMIGNQPANDRNLEGQIHNVRVYNRALTAAEVATLFNRPWEGTDYQAPFYTPPAPADAVLSTDTAATSLMSGCVAWWPLTDGTGNTAADVVGTNDATGTGVAWENILPGNTYDASGGYVQSGSFPVTNVSAFSISAWIKNNNTNSEYLGLWDSFPGGTVEKSVLWRNNVLEGFVRNAANTLEGALSTGQNLNSKALESHNGMAHCVFVVDNGTATWYMNGSQVAQNLSFMAGPYIPTANTDGFVIGGGHASGMSTGNIQNVRVWDRAVTADEVTLLYERPFEGLTYGDTHPYDPPATLALGTTAADIAINTNCVGWWPLLETDDYASGAADISGNANNGTQSGGVLSAVSELGGVASFDGVDDEFTIPHSSDFNAGTTGALSVSAWVYVETATDYRVLVGKDNSGAGREWLITYDYLTSKFRFHIWNSSNTLTDVQSATTYPLNNWFHVVQTWDGSNLKGYVDGVEVATTAASITPKTSTSEVKIGDNSGNQMDGFIQNVRVWGRALSAAEVQSLYETPWIGSNYTAEQIQQLFNYIFRSKRFRRL